MDHRIEKVGVIIPSLNPDNKLLILVSELKAHGFRYIVIVDDGSLSDTKYIFQAAKDDGVSVLSHVVNQGKGRALKTAFNYFVRNHADCVGAVTVDSDGQHAIADILSCAGALLDNQDRLIVGCRNFADKSVPFRSRFGNVCTRKMMRVLCGIALSDTQTGLRGISNTNMRLFLSVPGERFEYETQMLLTAKERGIEFIEVPIATIYIEDNKSSHFNPLVDSFKIYKLFARYCVSSLSCFAVDILLFALFAAVIRELAPAFYIAWSTILARIISSIVNYFINKNKVFASNLSNKTIKKYFLLVAIQMLASGALVTWLHGLMPMSESMVKIIVDMLLFCLSFYVQREWVFSK